MNVIYTFRRSFQRTSESKVYGRSASWAERPILSPPGIVAFMCTLTTSVAGKPPITGQLCCIYQPSLDNQKLLRLVYGCRSRCGTTLEASRSRRLFSDDDDCDPIRAIAQPPKPRMKEFASIARLVQNCHATPLSLCADGITFWFHNWRTRPGIFRTSSTAVSSTFEVVEPYRHRRRLTDMWGHFDKGRILLDVP